MRQKPPFSAIDGCACLVICTHIHPWREGECVPPEESLIVLTLTFFISLSAYTVRDIRWKGGLEETSQTLTQSHSS